METKKELKKEIKELIRLNQQLEIFGGLKKDMEFFNKLGKRKKINKKVNYIG